MLPSIIRRKLTKIGTDFVAAAIAKEAGEPADCIMTAESILVTILASVTPRGKEEEILAVCLTRIEDSFRGVRGMPPRKTN